MGVQGLARLLREEGYLPAETYSCVKSLWRGHHSNVLSDEALDHLSQIPFHSTLALDGNGLAYYLHHVAYSRHFSNVTGGNALPNAAGCCCKTRHLSETQVTRLLPQYMPLSLLQNVTKEFVESLHRHGMKLVVYWDGKRRQMKADTTQERKEIRNTEWSNLQQYCMYGVVPRQSSSMCRKDWLYNFPMSRLLLHQVKKTLSEYSSISMIQCQEEADRFVAKASADDVNCYSVGLDSDYCLFPNVRYIPLNTLDASGSVVTAVVVTRCNLAEQLDLPTETSMIEFAILMGNDYIGNPKDAQLDFMSFKGEEILHHVREQGPNYRVTSKLPQVQLAIAFTRALYQFEDLSQFPMDETAENEMGERNEKAIVADPFRPTLPVNFDLSLAVPQPLDIAVSKVVARPVQAFLDTQEENSLLRQEHLDAYLELVERLQRESPVKLKDDEVVRPVWENVMAAYVIERTIAHIFREHSSSLLVRMSSPARVFDHSLFHSILKKNTTETAPNGTGEGTNFTHVKESKEEERPILPIDEHETEILDAVNKQRVTIIHGETGCGKSSRVPVMLLRAPPPDSSMHNVKMFISQPRRIAAKSLVERVRSCEPDLKMSIALRMGHGVREYENPKTRAWFVTTGYLVRLLANHPENFNDCSHLIIDEVHERSVDTDILCLLCRRLLDTNKRIRLILMSATMAATLYQSYFGVPEPPIHVGARRFQIKEYYIEDMMKKFSFPPADMKAAKAIVNDCDRSNCTAPPSNSYMDHLFKVTARLVMCVGRPGSSILVFVPGMNEIVSITDLVEKLYVPAVRFSCYPIHSDVPFEEQMTAFDSPDADEVKVVIATNAAESSVTLPDVDHVICLGLCKQIVYNASSHRQMLMPAWISRASAIQRAGRTGRVRKGNVYRLYTKSAFQEGMDLFETGEMLRIPLDSVILMLKEMLQEEATPVLLQCLEPPDLSTIERSFKSLCDSNFISDPDDSGKITTLGKFVSSIGIDLALGSLIGLGIQFGVGPEAIELAAVLTFPKTPWVMTSPLFHDPPEFNDITARTFSSRCHFDANLYSEPFAIMNMMADYEKTKNQNAWTWHYSLSAPRLRRLIATKNNLRNRVADFMGIDAESLCVAKPPVLMEHSKVTLLRVLQVWVFSETIIESIQAAETSPEDAVTLSLTGDTITSSHLEQILDPERHPFAIVSNRETVQSGSFIPITLDDCDFSMALFLSEFECRFVSYGIEKSLDVFWYSTEEEFHFFAPWRVVDSGGGFTSFSNTRLARFQTSELSAQLTNQRRGVKERSCGLWDVRPNEFEDKEGSNFIRLTKWSCTKKKVALELSQFLNKQVLELEGIASALSCTFTKYRKKKGNLTPNFSLVLRGMESEISKADLTDLFATPKVTFKTKEKESKRQKIVFPSAANSPISYAKQKARSTTGEQGPETSWNRPLLDDIPEGARLLTVLASGRRKEHSIRFSADKDIKKSSNGQRKDDDSYLEVFLNKDATKISKRWRQFSSDKSVYVAENSVPAATMSRQGPVEVFACCANTLEVRGGGLRVEGLTLLPPGRLYILLSFLTFGLKPFTTSPIFPEDSEDEDEYCNGSLLTQALKWLSTWENLVAGICDSAPMISSSIDRGQRILAAKTFHSSCANLGETLVCHPDKVIELCRIFDMIDGFEVKPWDDLDDNPFVLENLRRGKTSKGVRRAPFSTPATRIVEDNSESHSGDCIQSNDVTISSNALSENNVSTKKAKKKRKSKGSNGTTSTDVTKTTVTTRNQTSSNGAIRETTVVDISLNQTVMSSASRLFATSLKPGETVGQFDLPSTNILSVVVRHYCDFLLQNSLAPDAMDEIKLERDVSLSDRHWLVRSVKDTGGKEWYLAEFVGTAMPFLSIKKRGGLPTWIVQGRARPSSPKHAVKCVPPHLENIPRYTVKVEFSDCESCKAVFFDSVETALRMEAAFWLERQFRESHHHWYQQTLEEMMKKAITLEKFVPRDD